MLRKILLISLPSLLILLLFLELGLRLGGVLYLKLHYPRANVNHAGSVENTFNILCLGDSFTFGLGASFENSYPRQLERLLWKNMGAAINVINAGRLGNTSSLLLKNLEKDIALYRPHIAIVMIGCNNSWNFEDSSYFKLYKERVGYLQKIDRMLNHLKIYKLIKIRDLNFRNSKNNKSEIMQANINDESLGLSTVGTKLFLEGRFDSAEENLRRALLLDKNNYYAHLWLAHIYNARSEFEEGRQELWKAIQLVGEWDDNLVYDVICRIPEQKDSLVVKKELNEIKRYIETKYAKNSEKRESLVKLIDAKLDFSENKQIYQKILEYDLGEVARLAKSKGVILILQTYPHDGSSLYDVFQKVSGKFNIPLVDNFSVFQELGKHVKLSDFFVPDKHCNDKGYSIIAENIYQTLRNCHLLTNIERYN